MKNALTASIALALTITCAAIGGPAEAAEANGYEIASGQAILADGSPAAGAQVNLFLLAKPQVEENLEDGDSYSLDLLATTVADENGDYTLTLPDLSVIRPSDLNDEGMANFEVDTFAGDEATSYTFAQKFGTVTQAARAGHATLRKVARVAKAVHVPSRLVVLRAKRSSAKVARAARAAASTTRCDKTLQDSWKTRTVLGVGYHGADGVPTDFVYTTGASSSLGVGISASGAAGSWSANGTKSKSSNASVGFNVLTGTDDSYWSSYYRYGKYKEHCVTIYSSGGVYESTRYYAEPMNFAGGTAYTTPSELPTTPKAYCSPFNAGDQFWKHSSTAVSFSTGVKTGGVLGVDFSARTGYEDDAKLHFDFNKARLLCGTNGDPGGTPKQIVVRALAFAN